jgi:hypothetical protein
MCPIPLALNFLRNLARRDHSRMRRFDAVFGGRASPRHASTTCRKAIFYSSFRNAEIKLRRRCSSVVVKRWTDPLSILGRAGMPANEGMV